MHLPAVYRSPHDAPALLFSTSAFCWVNKMRRHPQRCPGEKVRCENPGGSGVIPALGPCGELQAEEGGDAKGDGSKAGKKVFLTSQESPAVDHFLSSAPRGPGRQGKFYLATKVFRLWFHSGEIFFMFNDQFLKTEMSSVLR